MTEAAFQFTKADRDLFAVYQTIYSGLDVEMWYDWPSRLEDTKWSDHPYFLTCGGVKIAGVILEGATAMYPFLIPPFNDRAAFWHAVHRRLAGEGPAEIHANGVSDEEMYLLLAMGYQTNRIRMMMARPTDHFTPALPDGYSCRIPSREDIPDMATLMFTAYQGEVDYRVFGEPTPDEVRADIEKFINIYLKTDTLDHCTLIYDTATGTLAGLCMAGIHPEMPNGFAGISDIGVSPAHRGRGLASFMIERAIDKAHARTPVIKLCVTVGNASEGLYRQLGFAAGPRFTNMTYTKRRKEGLQ